MAYKQNNNPLKGASMHGSHNKDNDGASIAFLAALGPLVAKIGGAIAGIGKGALVKGGSAAVQAGVQGGTKLAAKGIAQGSAKGITRKMGKEGIKSIGNKVKQSVIQEGGTKAAGRVAKKSAKKTAKTMLKESGNVTKQTLKETLSNTKNQVKNKVSQSVDKIADATGKSRDEIIDMGKSKALTAGVGLGSKGVEKISEGRSADVQGLKQETSKDENQSSSYSNPVGPSMAQTLKEPSDALHPSNIKKSSGLKYAIDNFSAPVNIKGIDVDAGNVLRGALALGKHAKGKVTRSKKIKEIKSNRENLKQSAKKAANASFMKKMAQDLKIENLKG